MNNFRPAIPPELAQYGPPTAVFRPSNFRVVYALGSTAMLVFFGFFSCFGMVYSVVHPPDSASGFFIGEAVLLGLLTFIGWAAYWLIPRNLRMRHLQVLFYPNILAIQLRQNDVAFVPWDSIRSLSRRVCTASDGSFAGYDIELDCQDGTAYHFRHDEFHTVELAKALEEETTRWLLPRAREALDAHGVVQFGHLTLSRKALMHGEEALPLDEIKDIVYDAFRNDIRIGKEGRWFDLKLHIGAIPNFFVFLGLLQELTGQPLDPTKRE